MKTTNKTYQYVFDYFGYDNQRRKLVDEAVELSDEILLYEKGIGDINNIIAEMSDVLNVMQQFILEYEISTQEIENVADDKMKRTVKRIGDGYYGSRKSN